MEACVITTYRCNARCQMCHTWKYPSMCEEEIGLKVMRKLPCGLKKINISGGEPALREDLLNIVELLHEKAHKIDISTNGYFTERLVAIGRRFPHVAFRISIDYIAQYN